VIHSALICGVVYSNPVLDCTYPKTGIVRRAKQFANNVSLAEFLAVLQRNCDKNLIIRQLIRAGVTANMSEECQILQDVLSLV